MRIYSYYIHQSPISFLLTFMLVKDQPFQPKIQQLTLETSLVYQKPYRRVPYLALVVISLCLSPFYYGFNIVSISTIQSSTLNQYFGSEAGKPIMFGILVGIVPVGAGLGSLFAPLFMKLMTRRNIVLFFNAIALLIAGIIQINNLYVLLACRFVQGFVIGNYMGVIPLYVKEVTPVPLRGMFGAMSQFFYIGGVVICYLFGLIFDLTDVDQQFFWRFMFSFTGITVLVQSSLILSNVIPESPISLIQSKKYSSARKVLALFNSAHVLEHVFRENITQFRQNNFRIRYRRREMKPRPLQDETQLSQKNEKNNLQQSKLKQSMAESDTQRSQKRRSRVFINPLYGKRSKHQKITNQSYTIDIETDSKVSKPHKKDGDKVTISIKAFIIGFQLPLMQQFSGVKIIIAQIGPILANYNKTLALYFPLIINLIPFIATALSVIVLAKFGRRGIILVGNIGVSLCGFAIAGFFYQLKATGNQNLIYGALAFIVLFTIIFGFTIGPVVWLYVPEIVPPKIVPLATFMNWLGVSFCVIATPIIDEKYGSPYPMFLFFGVVELGFFILNLFLVIETKGLEPTEIAQKLA